MASLTLLLNFKSSSLHLSKWFSSGNLWVKHQLIRHRFFKSHNDIFLFTAFNCLPASLFNCNTKLAQMASRENCPLWKHRWNDQTPCRNLEPTQVFETWSSSTSSSTPQQCCFFPEAAFGISQPIVQTVRANQRTKRTAQWIFAFAVQSATENH